jgi:Ca2+-binding RTX toxin-like protein
MAKITGTTAANYLLGTAYADTILGLGGNDVLEGRGGNDILDGGAGSDRLSGGAGTDTLKGGIGNDRLSGGTGNDIFMFGTGDGQDVITDFAAGDIIRLSGYSSARSLTQVGTSVVLTLSATDKITFSNAALATVKGALQFSGGTSGGGTTAGTITGTSSWDTLTGTAGNDTIYGLAGHDVINGGGGNDRIYGGLGGDDLRGGAGADVFVYSGRADAPPYGLMYYESDRILDFEAVDRIDLSAVDANSLLAGVQSFHFAGYSNGAPADRSAGSLYVGVDGAYTWIFGYTDNSGYPNFFIDLSGGVTPTSANFIL